MIKKILLTFFTILLLINITYAANYDLEIIQPQPGLDEKNRYYKAYPGLVYNVRAGVIGGDYPFTYELTQKPSGMTIDSNTGEINWPSPTTSGTPYSVSMRVTDAEGSVKTVSWTIRVTTDGFKFIDSVNGKSSFVVNGGDGSINNPWKSLKDMYEGDDVGSYSRNSYDGEFLYFREGRYVQDNYMEGSMVLNRDWGGISIFKPLVWLAYPNENPIIDLSRGKILMWQADDVYMEGLEFDINGNSEGKGFVMQTSDNVVIRKNKFYGITNGYEGGNNALLSSIREGLSYDWAFQDNEFNNNNKNLVAGGILGYDSFRVLVEDNIFINLNDGVYPKSGTQRWDIRNNNFEDVLDKAIDIGYYDDQTIESGDIEVRYNNMKDGYIPINSATKPTGHPVYVYRNTIQDNVQPTFPKPTNGPFNIYNNTIINDLTDSSSSNTHFSLNHIRYAHHQGLSNLINVYDNLAGFPNEGIVDSNGLLTGTYRDQYLGIRGHELSDSNGGGTGPPVDNAPPSPAPVITEDSKTENSITISWNQSFDSGSGMKEYEVFKNGNSIHTTNSLTYEDSGLDSDTEYTYIVRAIDNNNNGINSNPEVIRTEAENSGVVNQIVPANYDLEIIQPRANLDTKNRFYKAYPAILYNVRAGVIGGSYPFNYELTQAPSGMTIDSFTGEINWPSPSTSSSPHTVNMKVTDAEGSIETVTWTITVTTDGFKFIDANSGTSGASGTINDPWRSIKDMYEGDDPGALDRNSYQDDFIYFRDGTYIPDGYRTSEGLQLQIKDNKPSVWMAYPNERPVLDLGTASLYWPTNNIYIDGFDINNNGNTHAKSIIHHANGDGTIIRNNFFYGLSRGFAGGNSNHLYDPGSNSKYIVIQDNEFNNNGYESGGGIQIYQTRNVLVENNKFYDITGGVYPKDSNNRWDIRGNYFDIGNGDRIRAISLGGYDVHWSSGDYEVRYNIVKNGNVGTSIGDQGNINAKPVYTYRNTFLDMVEMGTIRTTNGPFKVFDNVIVNSYDRDGGSYTAVEHIKCYSCENNVHHIYDNLAGLPSAGIVDSDGLLTGTYRDQYLGIRGHEIPGGGNINGAGGTDPPQDITPPSPAPVMIDGTITENSIAFSWNASIDSGSGLKEYQIYRNGNIIHTTNSLNYEDTGRSSDTSYIYYIRAVDNNNNGINSVSKIYTTLSSNSGVVNQIVPAYYDLEIIQPQPNLDEKNRFYKAYPGLVYNVRAGVIGGSYPFNYELTQAPSGMIIDSNTGEINWPNPVERTQVYPVTVEVTGAEGSIDTVTWDIRVTKEGFRFIDSDSGNDNNDGTINSPWETFERIINAPSDDFIYFREGVYSTSQSHSWYNYDAPAIFISYPGETPEFDFANGGIFFGGINNKLYIDGLDINVNSCYCERAFSWVGSSNGIVIRNNNFNGLGIFQSSNNPSYLFATSSSNPGQYTVIQDNTASAESGGYFVLGYANNKVLIENNIIRDFAGGNIISPKDGNSMWFIRGNDIADSFRAIYVQGYASNDNERGPVVVEYNNLKGAEILNLPGGIQKGKVIFTRNTVNGRFYIRPGGSDSDDIIFSNNVIINQDDSTHPDRIRVVKEDPYNTINIENNLAGVPGDNIVDSNGLLTGTYRDQYLGKVGHEIPGGGNNNGGGTDPPICIQNWNCNDWSVCTNSEQTRTCIDSNNCGTNSGRPSQTQSCSSPPTNNLVTLSADSTYSGFSLDSAYDGNFNSDWASVDEETNNPDDWLLFTFSEEVDINSLNISWAYNTGNPDHSPFYMVPQNLQIQYWDGSSYVTFSNINSADSEGLSQISFSTISTNRLRLYLEKNDGNEKYNNIIWLNEVEIGFGESDTTPDPAVCGNNIVEIGETCDDGDTITNSCPYGSPSCSVCSSSCQTVTSSGNYCGDGLVQSEDGEDCDGTIGLMLCSEADGFGFDLGEVSCTSSCSYDYGACTTIGPDIEPPKISNIIPMEGNLAVGTTSVIASFTTIQSASCKYSTNRTFNYYTEGTSFDDFSTIHNTTLSNLIVGDYKYHIKCVDLAGNVNSDDEANFISFSIPEQEVTPTNNGGGSSSSGGGGGGSSRNRDKPSLLDNNVCVPDYNAKPWSSCLDGEQRRLVLDDNSCVEEKTETRKCSVRNTEIQNKFLNAKEIVVQKSENRKRTYNARLTTSYNEIFKTDEKIEDDSFVLVDGESGEEYLGKLVDEGNGEFFYSLERIDENNLADLKFEGLIETSLGEDLDSGFRNLFGSSWFITVISVVSILLIIGILIYLVIYIRKVHE